MQQQPVWGMTEELALDGLEYQTCAASGRAMQWCVLTVPADVAIRTTGTELY